MLAGRRKMMWLRREITADVAAKGKENIIRTLKLEKSHTFLDTYMVA